MGLVVLFSGLTFSISDRNLSLAFFRKNNNKTIESLFMSEKLKITIQWLLSNKDIKIVFLNSSEKSQMKEVLLYRSVLNN